MKNQCLNCKNVIKDKERDEVRTCTLSAALNNPSLIILGVKKMMNVLFGRTKMMKNTKLMRGNKES